MWELQVIETIKKFFQTPKENISTYIFLITLLWTQENRTDLAVPLTNKMRLKLHSKFEQTLDLQIKKPITLINNNYKFNFLSASLDSHLFFCLKKAINFLLIKGYQFYSRIKNPDALLFSNFNFIKQNKL